MTRKILYGVCGIGNGHTQRQLPLLEYFSKDSQIVIFAFDLSLNFFKKYFIGNSNVTVVEVAVPFYVGTKDGLDLEATAKLEQNQKDFDKINNAAFIKAREILGKPDLVISDYEPNAAKYGYEHGVSVVTIDQQSKYLYGLFPKELGGLTYMDEVARLKMFFPTAATRIACSFFDVARREDGEKVLMFPPIINQEIWDSKNNPIDPRSILVYLTSQREYSQSLEELINIFKRQPETSFHIFSKDLKNEISSNNVFLYKHGHSDFKKLLMNCSGIISTAGHTLLSEAMHLGIPVYALPISLYEQAMNADKIAQNNFGVKSDALNAATLKLFIDNLEDYRNNIANDSKILLRGSGKQEVIDYLEKTYLKK